MAQQFYSPPQIVMSIKYLKINVMSNNHKIIFILLLFILTYFFHFFPYV